MREQELYLTYIPSGGGCVWAVFGEASMPDPAAFPEFMYRKYVVDETRADKVFKKLLQVMDDLNTRKVIPTRENFWENFPILEELLE